MGKNSEGHGAIGHVERIRVLAVGKSPEVARHPAAAGCEIIERAGHVILPGLANAHAHLDLTHIGPMEHDSEAGFVPWIDIVRERRARTPDGIARSVRAGIDLSRRGGVVAVGDIAGAPDGRPTLAPFDVMRAEGMAGVSYVEFFAIGKRELASRERVREMIEGASVQRAREYTRLGLQPHAPYSVDLRSYQWAAEFARARALPLATHLAETIEEREFVAQGTGPQRGFLESIGVWDGDILARIGQGMSPVGHLRGVLESAREAHQPILLVHLNGVTDADIEILARSGASVVYCPRASAYFGAGRTFGPHRYRDMLAAGVNVALGTDSIINLPPGDVTAHGITTLDDMRLLLARDGVPAATLLEMATTNAARAMGLTETWFRLQPGADPLAVAALPIHARADGSSCLDSAIRDGAAPEMLFYRKKCDLAENQAAFGE